MHPFRRRSYTRPPKRFDEKNANAGGGSKRKSVHVCVYLWEKERTGGWGREGEEGEKGEKEKRREREAGFSGSTAAENWSRCKLDTHQDRDSR